jgi:hypothetical protein
MSIDLPDIYNLEHFRPIKPDILKISVNHNNINVYYNDFQIYNMNNINIEHIIYNLNGSPVNNMLGNKVIRAKTDEDSIFYLGGESQYSDITLNDNTICKLDYVDSIIISEVCADLHNCIIYIYGNNTIIRQPSCTDYHISSVQRNTLNLIDKLDGAFAYGIVFNCKSEKVNDYLIRMKYYNHYKGLIMIPSKCDGPHSKNAHAFFNVGHQICADSHKCSTLELYYYKYVIKNVVYLALHKIIIKNIMNDIIIISIFATKDKINRVRYDFNKFKINTDNLPKRIEIDIKDYNQENGLFAFTTNIYI